MDSILDFNDITKDCSCCSKKKKKNSSFLEMFDLFLLEIFFYVQCLTAEKWFR